jgi:hypothetical protein
VLCCRGSGGDGMEPHAGITSEETYAHVYRDIVDANSINSI